ncbi:MAG: mRNA interferase MazF [Thermoanaerobacter sp.]|jgi:mRNA interferase MazF|nr:mRNA interferase MazF [Thermoanaerobacter sp.]MDN5365238.1 mRNA interferase MazF [Thermacetogenium sp.]
MANPLRGEVWLVDLNPVRGHEQAGRRPALVISVDMFNSGPAELVVVLPITTKDKGIPLHVRIDPPEGGVKETSFVKCEDIRSVSTERLTVRLGRVSRDVMALVEDRVRVLLGL